MKWVIDAAKSGERPGEQVVTRDWSLGKGQFSMDAQGTSLVENGHIGKPAFPS